jgi:hypothetical protein
MQLIIGQLNLPDGAIRQKMNSDSMDLTDIENFFSGNKI